VADSGSPRNTPATEAWRDGSGPLWRAVIEELPDPLMVIRPDRRIAFLNFVARRLYPDVAPGDPALDLVQPLLRPELDRSLDQIFAGGEPRAREFPIRFQSGIDRWLAAHTGPVRLRGVVVGAVVVARDITERRRIDAALRESEQRYRSLVEHASEAIVVFDVDRERFVDVNQNATALFGMSRDALLEADPATLSPPAQPGGVRPVTSPASISRRLSRGKLRPSNGSIAPRKGRSGAAKCAWCTCRPKAAASCVAASATSPGSGRSRSTCASVRSWRRSVSWPAASRTTSTTSSW
jgi:PAS domain S-box-containing protein